MVSRRVSKPEMLMRQSRAEIINRLSRGEEGFRGSKIIKTKKDRSNLDHFRQELQTVDHKLPVHEIIAKYESDIDKGLTTHTVIRNLQRDGPNALQPPKTKSRLLIFCEYMFCGFSLLLWAGVILCVVGYIIAYVNNPLTVPYDNVYIGTLIICVIIITGLFGFFQESSNNAIMESFRKMIPKYTVVMRNGQEELITCEQLVVGDIIKIRGGDCIPADIRIIEAKFLKVDNSSITGESDPQPRSTENTDPNPLETANLAFYGTNVVEGDGKGIIIATGDRTLMGHIAKLTSGLQSDETPIKKELKQFIKIISVFATFCGLIVFTLSMMINQNVIEAFIYFIAIVIANLPEGLLVTMTACLTLTAKKMAKKNCLCKNLHAIETLGSTTVICSDKTGTLTQNRMTVSHMYYDNCVVDVLSDTFIRPASSGQFALLARVGILCSRADFKPHQDHIPLMDRIVLGDASETAVLKCMEKFVGQTADYRKKYPKVFEIPFNSTNKYQLSIHKNPVDLNLLMVIKGAPERVIDKCDRFYSGGKEQSLSEVMKDTLKSALLELGYMGERVLGFADYELSRGKYPYSYVFNAEKPNYPLEGFRFLGFMSMIDPPREGVPEAVLKCKTAGIRVIMVTGDHPITALSIAKKVGIISPENETVYDIAMRRNISVHNLTEKEILGCKATVVTGNDLRDMDRGDLADIIEAHQEIVFARTSPQQKLQIVEAFQRANEIVAVTGDGVNDSPALKRADIGVAMGISGSEVSKEAADMIILDDNFASIVVGIEEGRLIFDNLKKSIAYMMTSNIPEIAPFLIHVCLGTPCALSIISILLIDVGTDMWPGISLAYEKAEADIMLRRPRNPLYDRLVSWKLIWFTSINIGLVQAIGCLSTFFFVMSEYGFAPSRLLYIRDEWESAKNDVLDSYGQEWAQEDREQLLRKGVSAAFLAIVITQIADCIICKTRRLSIIHQGMSNWVMNFGILFEICVATLAVYCPGLNTILQFDSIKLYLLVPAIPFACIIIIFDETRKYLLRKKPGGWVDRETYF